MGCTLWGLVQGFPFTTTKNEKTGVKPKEYTNFDGSPTTISTMHVLTPLPVTTETPSKITSKETDSNKSNVWTYARAKSESSKNRPKIKPNNYESNKDKKKNKVKSKGNSKSK